MAVVVSCRGKLQTVGVWTDAEAAGGTNISTSPNVLTSGTNEFTLIEERQNIETREHELQLEIRHDSAQRPDFQISRVVRLTLESACFKEFRIDDVRVSRSSTGAKVAKVTAVGMGVDLTRRGGQVLQPYANGELDPVVQLYGVDPAAVIAWVIRNSRLASFVQVGQVDFTKTIDVTFDRYTPQRCLEEIVARVEEREGVPAYLQFLRNGVTSYDIQLVSDPAPGADTVTVDFGDNELGLEKHTSHERFGTLVYVSSGGESSEILTIADAMWIVQGVAGATITFRSQDEPFGEDDQLNGKFLEMPDGITRIEVLDTIAASHQVVLASAPASLSPGERVRFVDDAAGTDLEALPSPSAQAAGHGEVTQILERPDIPPINNFVPENAYCTDFTAGQPDHFTLIANGNGQLPTASQETGDAFSRYGLSSLKLVMPPGSSIKRDAFRVNLRNDKAHITAMSMLWVTLGSLRFELHDVTDPNDVRVWYPKDADNKARTPSTEFWAILSIFPGGFNFYERAARLGLTYVDIELHWIAEEENTVNTTAYIDAVQAIRRPIPVDNFYDGSAGNALWWVARDYLKAFNAPLDFFTVQYVDKDRMGLISNEETVPGSFAAMTDAGIGVSGPVTKRIIEATWNHLRPGRTEIQVEQIPAGLDDRFLGKPRAPVRVYDPTTQKPGCGFDLAADNTGDLEVRWKRVPGASRYELRRPALNGTPAQQWLNGDFLWEGDTTSWVLKQGTKTAPPSGTPALSPADIATVMIEAFNADGVPSECYETATPQKLKLPGSCRNLITDAAVSQTFCQPNNVAGTPPILVHTFQPIDIAVAQITPGVDRVSLCLEGSTLGGQTVINGYGCPVKAFISGFNHFRLERFDAGSFAGIFPHSNQVGGSAGNRKHSAVANRDNGDGTFDVRVAYSDLPQTNAPDWLSTAGCCQETINPGAHYHGLQFQPGVASTPGIGGAFSQVWYSNGHTIRSSTAKLNAVTVHNLSNNQIRLTRNAGHPFMAAAQFTGSGPFTGTGRLEAYGGNDRAGGFWDTLEVLNSAGTTVLHTFRGTDHPRGKIWMGDEFDLGTGLTLANYKGVNSAGTLGLLTEGFVYEEYWATLAANGFPIPAEYTVSGNATMGANALILSGSASVIRNDQGPFDEVVSEAVVVNPAVGNADIGAIVASGHGADVRAAGRIRFSDGTVVTGAGVSTGSLSQYATERVLTDYLWPAGAVSAEIDYIQIGTGAGQSCYKEPQLVIGAACCQNLIVLPGLPPSSHDCLLPPRLIFVSLDTCAGGQGLLLRVEGEIETTSLCPNLDNPPATLPGGGTQPFYELEFRVFEDWNPGSASPGQWDLVRTIGPLPAPVANPIGGAPVPYSVSFSLTDQDPKNRAATPGAVRGSNAPGATFRNLFVEVTLKDTLTNSRSVRDTAILGGAAYGFC